MKNIPYSTTITVSSGVGSITTATFLPMKNSSGKIVRLLIIPPNESFKYGIYVSDATRRIYERKGKVGTSIADREIDTVKETHTIGLENATNGVYTLDMVFRPDW